MNIIINGIDFWDDFKAEKYWSPTKNQNLKEIVNNAIWSGRYTASEKIDGDWRMLIRDMDGNFHLRGRSESVNGGFADKIDWIPHIVEDLNDIPNGTVFLGELYLPSKRGSRNVTTIMGCLKEKALARQEKSEKLSYYIFDILAYNGKQILDLPLSTRLNIMKDAIVNKNRNYISLSHYYSEPCAIEELMGKVLESGGEGIVLKRLDGIYEQGKRPARKSIKVKQEIANDIDCFLTGRYKLATIEYTGKELPNWTYWMNVRTGEKFNKNMYDDYHGGDGTIIPITKSFYNGWAGSIELGVYRDNEIVPVCWISNVTEEVKQGIVENNSDWKYRVVKVQAMMIEKDTKALRHSKIIAWRANDEKSWQECDGHEIYDM